MVKKDDLVMGGSGSAPRGAVVLGGEAGEIQRLRWKAEQLQSWDWSFGRRNSGYPPKRNSLEEWERHYKKVLQTHLHYVQWEWTNLVMKYWEYSPLPPTPPPPTPPPPQEERLEVCIQLTLFFESELKTSPKGWRSWFMK